MTFISEMKAMIRITFLLPLLASCMCCGKLKIAKGTPDCVKAKIKSFDAESNCDKDVNVKEYRFQGKTVYVFDPGSCGADMTSEVISPDCKTLGYLGGFIGNTKINGEEFSNAVLQATVWHK
ncbi:MAG: hypothetical protein K0R65_2700 [Crocinitomicaceae bacterium]|jgi:hypothetical protein|nr:hypothetical protein [Crocinitomicaceae bacterium]